MRIRSPRRFALAASLAAAASLGAQQPKPEDTEVWAPVPKVVTPGSTNEAPPSDAVVLFDGRNLDEWQSVRDKSAANWTVSDGVITVNKAAGDIETRRTFRDYQLHLEWRIPINVTGTSQERGNSGVFLAVASDGIYELQVVDSYNNPTYVNGMAGSLYKQSIPLVNASRKPGEWQTYDVVWTAPTFDADGKLRTPAYVTVFFNGLLVANHFAMLGETRNAGLPSYTPYTRAPIALQAHGDPSPPISFRNIWIRELAGP